MNTLTSVRHNCAWCPFSETVMVELHEIEVLPDYWLALSKPPIILELRLCPTCAARFHDLENDRRALRHTDPARLAIAHPALASQPSGGRSKPAVTRLGRFLHKVWRLHDK